MAGVRVAVHVRRDARPVGAAAGERAGEVVAGEVGLFDVAGDAVGVVGAEAEVVQVVGGVGEVAARFDLLGAAAVSFGYHILEEVVPYSSALSLVCRMMIDPDIKPSFPNVLYGSITWA